MSFAYIGDRAYTLRQGTNQTMNERMKRFSIGAAILLLSLGSFEASFSQQQNQLIKPCVAGNTTEKKEGTTKKPARRDQKTKDRKKDRNDKNRSKGSNCS
jgi:hypothetical protein